MRTFSILLLSILTLCCFSGCGRAETRAAAKAQGILDESDLLIEARNFPKAREGAIDAMRQIDDLLKANPDNISYQLLKVRAHLIIFMTKNILIIENAEPKERSLVRLPDLNQYADYDLHITYVETELKKILDNGAVLSDDQKAYIHGTLASVFRLNTKTLELSDQEYAIAQEIYQKLRADLKHEKKKIGTNDWAITRAENIIRDLQMARAEVDLLAEKWDEALKQLGDAFAGDDLKFFSTHFKILLSSIASLEAKLQQDELLDIKSREDKLLKSIATEKRKRTLSKTDKLAAENPYRLEMLQNQMLLNQMQNNLMYRIICYKQLGDGKRLKEAREILHEFFPELEEELMKQLG
jgi:hypothetical protein